MGHGRVLGWLVDLPIRLWSFHDSNGSEWFIRLYDATTGLSISLSLASRSWKGGMVFSLRLFLESLILGCPLCYKFQFDT